MSFKARLLFISWIKVDGALVYKAEPKSTKADESESKAPVVSETPVIQEAPASETSEPVAEPVDEATDAQTPALAESF